MTDVPAHVHEFDWPDRVVVGTIGLPGARTFYLQVRAGTQIVSIALEKQQAAQLAEKIDEILDQLRDVEGNPHSVPTSTPIELVDNDQLEAVQEQFARFGFWLHFVGGYEVGFVVPSLLVRSSFRRRQNEGR